MKQFNDPHYLVRKLKPYLSVNANTKIIALPQGIQLDVKAKKYMDLLVQKYNFSLQTTIDVPKHNLVYINRSLGLCGNKISFIKLKVFGITPGTKVTQIGEGKVSRNNFLDKFSVAYEYAGAIILSEVKYYAFKMPEALAPAPDKDFYFLYTKDKYNLYRNIYTIKNKLDYQKKLKGKIKIQTT